MSKTPANPFDIEFVAEEPPAPRVNERDDARWAVLKEILDIRPGVWARAKVYTKPNSAQIKASNINGDHNKAFPSADYEARYTKDAEAGTSTLFLMRKGAAAE